MTTIYGLLISISIISCILVVQHLEKHTEGLRAKVRGLPAQNKDFVWNVAFWAVFYGVLGARIYHILSNIPHYYKYPLQMYAFWNGGLGIWGAIIGGALGVYIALRKKPRELWHYLDLGAVALPLGQAIGRWGNYFNQELFGKPTFLPWKIYIPYNKRPPQYLNQNFFHPLFFYEFALDLLLFIGLFVLYKKRSPHYKTGTFILIYLVGYSLIRFFLEFLRIDPWTIAGLNVAQMVSILTLTASSIIILRRNFK